MLLRKILNFRSLEWPIRAISWRNSQKGTSKNCVISEKLPIISLEKDFCNFLKSKHIFIIFHSIFLNLTENVAKYSEVTKEENIMYTIRVCNMIFHLKIIINND
jgi:hypothetical protein